MGFFWGGGDRTCFWRPVFNLKKKLGELSHFFFVFTYDQYVQRWVVIPEREGFHLKTRSVMKQLLEDAKCKVLLDKSKKCALFKILVDLWRRLDNLPEDRAKRAGLGAARRDRLQHTYRSFQHTWPPSVSIWTGCAPDGLVGNSCTARRAIFPQIDFWGYTYF